METSTYIVFLDLSNLLSHSNFREGNLCKQSLSHNYYYFLPSTIKLIRFLKSMYHWHHNHRWVKVKVHLIKRRNFLYSHREYSPRKPTVHLSYPPPSHQYSVLRVFKATLSYTERKEVETRMWDLGIELGTLCTRAAHQPTVPPLHVIDHTLKPSRAVYKS